MPSNIDIQKLQTFLIEETLPLEQIKKELTKFNPFNVLGIAHRELAHSNFLAWMMRPEESHQIDDYFLKAFLALLTKILDEDKIKLFLGDLSQTTIHREWRNIDILIVNDALKTVILIENKVWAGLRPKQLEDYAEEVQANWGKGWKKYYVYLTALPRSLDDSAQKIDYENITYEQIQGILETILKNFQLEPSVKNFLQHYINNIKLNIMNTHPLSQQARDIYLKHKEAIDFIVSQKPAIYSRKFLEEIDTYFTEHEHYTHFPKGNGIIRILPKAVEDKFRIPGFNSWPTNDEKPAPMFTIEFFIEEKRLWIKFCFGGINNEDENVIKRLQITKTEYFNKMKDFASLKGKTSKSRATSAYPKVASFTLYETTTKGYLGRVDDISYFIEQFKQFEKKHLKNWIEEVQKNL